MGKQKKMMRAKHPATVEKKSALLFYLITLTAFFVLLEISFVIQCSGVYLGDFHLIASHLKIPALVIPGILYFLFAQLLVHSAFVFIIWMLAVGVSKAQNYSAAQTDRTGLVLWFVGLLTILFANRYFFPNSKYSTIFFNEIPIISVNYSLAILLVFFSLVLLLAFYGWLRCIRNDGRYKIAGLFLSAFIIVSGGWFFFAKQPPVTDAGTAQKPNIIIIGVDSLRPDFLSFFGYSQLSPHFDYFLNQATVFAESVTPIARTYGSWVSILTSEYPKQNTVRADLSDQSKLNMRVMMPMVLRQHGYKTFYATDDTRFSNIDAHFGFDETVTPPIGFNDFLLGTLNDFPMSNLIVNTWLGKYLFPHSYGSRSVFITYEPNSFLNLMAPKLAEPRTKPLFLITHFCLPHYPYAWASLPIRVVSLHHYQASVQRMDEQFHDFMELLKKDNLLQHSIVILLSDHGEGVEIPGDRITEPYLFMAGKNNPKKIIPRFYPESDEHETVDRSGGHGTDVLGLSQYHTVFAVRTFGTEPNQIKVVPGLVSLMDIKPTLFQFLQLPLPNVAGHSLMPIIFGQQTVAASYTDFFTESDFSPQSIRTVHPEMRKVLFEGIDYFKIDPHTARVVVKEDMLKKVISSKQYADLYGAWILALYPQSNNTMVPILVNLKSGEWTDTLTTPFALQSPAAHMLQAMKKYYGNDLKPIMLEGDSHS